MKSINSLYVSVQQFPLIKWVQSAGLA